MLSTLHGKVDTLSAVHSFALTSLTHILFCRHTPSNLLPLCQLQTVLTNRDTRIKELERQIAETEASSVTAIAVKDQCIIDLEKQLAEASKVKSLTAEQVAALTSKSNRIEELEKQLTVNDHNHRMDLLKVGDSFLTSLSH